MEISRVLRSWASFDIHNHIKCLSILLKRHNTNIVYAGFINEYIRFNRIQIIVNGTCMQRNSLISLAKFIILKLVIWKSSYITRYVNFYYTTSWYKISCIRVSRSLELDKNELHTKVSYKYFTDDAYTVSTQIMYGVKTKIQWDFFSKHAIVFIMKKQQI